MNTDHVALISLKEAASRMGISRDYLRDLCLRGDVASLKIGTRPGKRGGRRLIPISEINGWISRNLRRE